ncbi:MAG: DUF1667 domain-containing protein [Synergistales bacterium]|jgi:CxxC motif-containing protein
MSERELVCVVCPNGCSIHVDYEDGNPPRIVRAEGARCPRGKAWVQQEMEDPRRTFSTSVLVPGGDFLEASVRLTKPVPLSKVFDVMEEIKKVKLKPPLEIGDVILTNPAGTETEVVITRNVIARRTS